MDLPIKNGDFPEFFVCLPEGHTIFRVADTEKNPWHPQVVSRTDGDGLRSTLAMRCLGVWTENIG